MVEQIVAGPLGERMRHSLGRRHGGHSDEEIKDAFSEAASQALRSCRSTEEGAVYTWMWRAMNSILVSRARHLAREVPTPDDAALFERAGPDCDLQQTLDRRAHERELAILFERLAEQLAARQQAVLALHVRDFARSEQARELGVSQRIIKRDLERILSRARTQLVARCGGGCDHGTTLVWRLAFGLASSEQAQQAQLHLLECQRCQAFLDRLGWWREAAAAAIPVPAVQELDPVLAERALHVLAERLSAAKQQLADAATQAKQHTAAGYTRAVEYTPLATARPGAAATAIAGCLALGGGAATYCIDRGVDPIAGFVDVVQPAPAETKPEKPPKQPPVEQQPPEPPQLPASEPATTPAPAPPQEPPAPAEPQPAATPAPPPPPPPPEPTPPAVQFGEPTNPGPAYTPSSTASPPQSAKPAPVPQNGGTDLYGP